MIIPSIDLMNGKIVQLVQGKKKELELKVDPLEFAKKFAKFKEVQVIDLDAAMERGNNFELVKKLCKVVNARVGGGIREVEKAGELIKARAKKIIIGTKADKEFLQKLCKEIGRERTIVALDAMKGKVVVKGWKEATTQIPIKKAKELESYCGEFFYTCVEREGLMKGADWKSIKKLKDITNNKLSVAGGICSMKEVKKLEKMGIDAVVGMAIYTGKIKLPGVKI